MQQAKSMKRTNCQKAINGGDGILLIVSQIFFEQLERIKISSRC